MKTTISSAIYLAESSSVLITVGGMHVLAQCLKAPKDLAVAPVSLAAQRGDKP